MPKEFFTERDIEDMMKRGTTSLQLSDDIVLTELAYEKAQRLGLQLTHPNIKPPAAPERPYISTLPLPDSAVGSPPPVALDLRQRIKEAVASKLGVQVDPVLLDSIITRVLEALSRK
jgi:hypothetical protein